MCDSHRLVNCWLFINTYTETWDYNTIRIWILKLKKNKKQKKWNTNVGAAGFCAQSSLILDSCVRIWCLIDTDTKTDSWRWKDTHILYTHTHTHTWKQLLKESPEERKKQNQCKSLSVYFIQVLIQLSHSLIYKGKICTQWALPSTARL